MSQFYADYVVFSSPKDFKEELQYLQDELVYCRDRQHRERDVEKFDPYYSNRLELAKTRINEIAAASKEARAYILMRKLCDKGFYR